MKVCYIVLTCKLYFETRAKWQLDTMFQHVNMDDIYFLGHEMNINKRLYSWGAPDDYNGLPYKIIDFFRYVDLDYDWYILIDDDTYVFYSRLISLLQYYSPTEKCCIGKLLTHLQHTPWGCYLSGGAGTVLSRSLYDDLKSMIRSHPTNSSLVLHWCADICLGSWIQSTGSNIIECSQFHTDLYNPATDDISIAITFHHLTEKQHYDFYFTL
jgi:hypothetical protein